MKRSIDIERMPSVRVRPTLRNELKHRVMICKVPQTQTAKNEKLNMKTLNNTVIDAMERSKRTNIGRKDEQESLIK